MRLVVMLVLLSLVGVSASALTYTYTDLGDFIPQSVNDQGAVVGFVPGSDANHPVIWENGFLTDLPQISGQASATANSINNSGTIVGDAGVGVIWQNGQGSVVPGMLFCEDVNNQGVIAGSSGYRAAIYANGNVTDLPLLPGSLSSLARAIDDNGQVVGISDPRGRTEATLWTETATVLLGAWSSKERYSDAFDVNGNFVSGSYKFQVKTRYGLTLVEHACLWNLGTQRFYDLGRDKIQSQALGVNSAGVSVGWAGEKAMIWIGAKGSELNRLVSMPSGWRLVCAYSINEAGQIAALAATPTTWRAVLLTPQ